MILYENMGIQYGYGYHSAIQKWPEFFLILKTLTYWIWGGQSAAGVTGRDMLVHVSNCWFIHSLIWSWCNTIYDLCAVVHRIHSTNEWSCFAANYGNLYSLFVRWEDVWCVENMIQNPPFQLLWKEKLPIIVAQILVERFFLEGQRWQYLPYVWGVNGYRIQISTWVDQRLTCP